MTTTTTRITRTLATKAFSKLLLLLFSIIPSRQVHSFTASTRPTTGRISTISSSPCSIIRQRDSFPLQQQQRNAFSQQQQQPRRHVISSAPRLSRDVHHDEPSSSMYYSSWLQQAHKVVAAVSVTTLLQACFFFSVALAENELSAKYGSSFDSSLVDQTCLVHHCSLQAKACLADDPSCRKGLTCTAKCLGDNACITGCMARYGNTHLDHLLKCTIEDHECIKVAILDGGADAYGQEPKSPGPTLQDFQYKTLEGTWYKVVGYNPNYDCYACQRNTFTIPTSSSSSNNNNHNKNHNNNNKLLMDVEFSMPHLMPDGSPPPPQSVRESIQLTADETLMFGSQSIGLNDYNTHETMIFDITPPHATSKQNDLVMKRTGSNQQQEVSYARTAHSEGEMFGLKFWENWYILGENDPGLPEFKFIYYNGKTRQNTYQGAFVYSRTRDLSPLNLAKVYRIAQDAGMNPQQFCKIRNGCFPDQEPQQNEQENSNSGNDHNNFLMDPFRGILASTKVSQLLGVEPVKAEGMMRKAVPTARILTPSEGEGGEVATRPWWYEVGDYFENPHRHFQAMDQLRIPMEWPESVVQGAATTAASSSGSSSSP